MKGRKGIITAAVAVAAVSACIALTAFGKGGGKQYEAAYVTRGNIAGSIEESGNVDGEDGYTYFARVTAPIERLDIKAGDRVTGGDLLLSYDISDYERSVSEAAISREQSEDDVKGKIDKSNEYSSKYNNAASDDNPYAILYAWQRESADSQDESQYTENWNIQCEADSLKKRIAGKNEDIAEKKTEYDKLSAAEKTGDKGKDIQGDIDELNEDIAGLNKGLAGLPPAQMTPDEYARFNDTANLMEDINRNWTQAKTEKKAYEEGILNKSQKEALEKQTDLLRSREEAAQIELAKAAEGVRADCSGARSAGVPAPRTGSAPVRRKAPADRCDRILLRHTMPSYSLQSFGHGIGKTRARKFHGIIAESLPSAKSRHGHRLHRRNRSRRECLSSGAGFDS